MVTQAGSFVIGIDITVSEPYMQLIVCRGCITPQVIGNVKSLIDGDMDLMDGYEELPEEWQEKFRDAIEAGHVPDEDWKGDVEFNRPGMKGFKRKTPKKKEQEEDDVSSR